MLTVTEGWRATYPGAHAGLLAMHDVHNPTAHLGLENRKQALEAQLRAQFAGQDRKVLEAFGPMPAYRAYYKRFKKTYHVQSQLESIAFKGRSLPSVAALVEAMFMAEVKNLLLTAGHDLGQLLLPLTLDTATGRERYTLLRGQEQELKAGDMFIADQAGVISSVIYGPDRRTQITPQTRDVVFTVYAPAGIEPQTVEAHLADIRDYALLVAPGARVARLEVVG